MSSIDPTSPVPPKNAISLLHRIARRVRRRRSAEMDPALVDIAVIEASQRFDKEFYKRRYPDIAASGMDPVQHYVRHGAAEGRDPSEEFSTAFYLKKNSDVAASGINPFRHYIEHGSSEGRVCRPTTRDKGELDTGHSKECDDRATAQQDMEIIARSALFDTRYYLENYADVLTSGMNPLVHFCRYGFKELRNPSREFDTTWYWLAHLPENIARNPLAHYLRNGSRDGLSIRAVGVFSEDDQQALADAANLLLQSKLTYPAELYERAGIALTRLKRWSGAETAFSMALALEWSNAKVHARLADVLGRQGKWWQAVESWNAATNLDPSRASWFFHLAEAQEKMNRFALAAEAYQAAIDREPHHSNWYYLLGCMHEMAGQQESAENAYSEAVTRDSRDSVKAFGIAVFHQDRGYWPEAAVAYARQLESNPASAELRFRLGMAHGRCYQWDKALAAYREAIGLDPSQSYWHYRCGFVLERLECWSEAAEAYAAAAMLSSTPTPYWHYRRGYVLARAGKYKEACLAYIRTYEQRVPSILGSNPAQPSQTIDGLSKLFERGQVPDEAAVARLLAGDITNASWHYLLGEIREGCEDWGGAADAYSNAVARSNSHPAAWYYRLGSVLFKADRFEDACTAFRETRILRRPFGVNATNYQKNVEQKYLMEYGEYFETLSVRPHQILYESMHGTSIGGNPYAMFEYIFRCTEYADWTHVWVIAPGVTVPDSLRQFENVVFVERQSDLYLRYLATSGYLINDVTFPYWFIRRPEQKYLNTWHGTPLKHLGRDVSGEFMVHGNVQRNLLQATHLISPNRHTSEVLIRSNDIAGVLTAKLAETGYPRIDRTLRASESRRDAIRVQLGLCTDKPVVLYAPTWRGEHGDADFDAERLRKDLAALAELPCQLVFRGHHMVEALLVESNLPVAIARQEVDTSDVLAIADILITDYSSIFFDFLPTRRPIIYYCYDLEDYVRSRGLYFDVQDMPGELCRDIKSLVAALACRLGSGEPSLDDAYDTALKQFCPHEDGHASARATAFLLHGDDTHVVDRMKEDRVSLLLFNGLFPPNGITSSFLNLTRILAKEPGLRLIVVAEPRRIEKEPTWREKLEDLPATVQVLARAGGMVMSPEETWLSAKLGERQGLPDAMWAPLQYAYGREFRRLFGDAEFMFVVNFEGYSAFWTFLLGCGARKARKLAFLHSDMIQEYVTRNPYLKKVFHFYKAYDKLVSVSDHMREINREKLTVRFGLRSEQFAFCMNTIDVAAIRQRAEEPLDEDLQPWFTARYCFLTVGRLSAEKDHAKLLDAFAMASANRPEARLVILGDGPLREQLRVKIRALGLEGKVLLAGQRSNPFPALVRCACFVLPSNHEGQPMVLLEAMTLGRPIIATNIDGSRAVLKDGQGILVDNCVEGLQRGMEAFMRGTVRVKPFDAEAHNQRAMRQFHKLIERAVTPQLLPAGRPQASGAALPPDVTSHRRQDESKGVHPRLETEGVDVKASLVVQELHSAAALRELRDGHQEVTSSYIVTGSLDAVGRKYGIDQSSLRHGYLNYYESILRRLGSIERIVIIAAGKADDIGSCFATFLPKTTVYVFSVGGQHNHSVEIPRNVVYTHLTDIDEVIWKVRAIGRINCIVEDSSNKKSVKLKLFRELFWQLGSGGVYVCEDLHAAGIASLVDVGGQDILEYVNKLCSIRRMPGPVPNVSKSDAALARAMGCVSNYGKLLAVEKAQDHLLKIVEGHESLRVLNTRGVSWMIDRTLTNASVFKTRANVLTNRPDFMAERFRQNIDLPELHIRTYKDVAYVPRQILVRDDLLLPDTFRLFRKQYVLNEQLDDSNKNYARLRDDSALRSKIVEGAYFHIDSEFPHQYGHAITEIVARLYGWRLSKDRDPSVKLLISSMKGDADSWSSLKPWVKLILTSYGIAPEDVCVRNTPGRFEEVTAVTPQFSNLGFAHPDIIDTWNELAVALRQGASVNKWPQRIFVGRGTDLKNRNCKNANEVEGIFVDHGFVVVYPEKLTLYDQVALFSNAVEIAGFGGSGMINAGVFGVNLRRMIVISPETYNATNEYLVSSVRGCTIVYAYCTAERQHPPGGWSHEAFQSPFSFDMGSNGEFIKSALSWK